MLLQEVLFRKTSSIPSPSFGIFSLYKYPAKFIPQVPAFVLENYAKKGMLVFDPFAGVGTVGGVARLYGLDYELWDLNPLLEHLHPLCETPPKLLDKSLMDKIKAHPQNFIPNWSNLSYWHPEEFLPMLSKAWSFYHHSADEHTKKLLLVPLLKLTKYFSYADEKVHKLYKSKHAKEKVEKLLREDYQGLFYRMLEKELEKTLQKFSEYQSLKPQKVQCTVRVGVDVLEKDLKDSVNILITSPPYLQAQEYIRSTKLELFWLGYTEGYIQSLSKREIPYREVPAIEVLSETYHAYRRTIEEKHLLKLYDSYFFAILSTLERLSQRVSDYMFVFVGPAKIRGQEIPIHEIVVQHLTAKGEWVHEKTYIDRIVSRVLFRAKKNPATGLEDQRMGKEFLVVLRRR
jgi:tRNA G10  N-methylase Trm11